MRHRWEKDKLGFGAKLTLSKERNHLKAANLVEVEEDEVIGWINFEKEVRIAVIIAKKFKVEWIDACKSLVTKIKR